MDDVQSFYGFKPVENTTIELAYNPDLSFSHYYIQVERNAYPLPICLKISPDFKIKESYPIYISSCENSIKIIKERIKYLGYFDFTKYAYLSWDMKNNPTEIYLPKSDLIEKYRDDKLEVLYYTAKIDELDNYEALTNEIKDFVRKERPNVFMFATKDNKLKKICLIFNAANEAYEDKRKQVKILDCKWIN